MAEVRSTIFPESPVTPEQFELDGDERSRLGSILYINVISSLADREILDETLDYWYSLLEMYSPPRDTPWIGASNVFIPIVPTHYHTLCAQIAQQVFQQRLFIVAGNTPEAAEVAHGVEHFYNAKAQKLDMTETFEQWKNLGLRDGASPLEILWKHTTRKQKVVVWEDELGANGAPKTDKFGRKVRKAHPYTIEVDDYNDVVMNPVELRDFVIIPAWQTSIDEAKAVGRKMYLDEAQLKEMVAAGYLWEEEIEQALNFPGDGSSDLPSDQQGWQTYTVGGKVYVGAEEGTIDRSLGMIRGPLEVWRIHSRQFDFDGDGVPEECVFWLHHQSQRLLGYSVYEYGFGKRPFVMFAPMPRPLRALGWSVIEWLAPIQAETNNLWNGRNDIVDIITRPPMYQRAGAKIITPQGQPWQPGVLWELSAADDVGFVGGAARQIDLSPSVGQEDRLMSWASLLSGATPNMAGAVNSGRRTAREISTADRSSTVRIGFIAQRLRNAIEKAFWIWNELQKQYGPEEQNMSGMVLGMPQQMTIQRSMLSQDLALSVSGSSGQLDQDAKAQQALQTFLLLKDDPDISTDPVKRYRLRAHLLEAQNNTNIISLLGTEQEAVEKAQQQAQFQQAVEQLAKQGVNVPMPPGMAPQPPQHGKPPVQPGDMIQ